MSLRINGKAYPYPPELTLQDALAFWGYEVKSVAVAINGAFVPRHEYDQIRLEDGCELEIVAPMQGG